MAGPAGGVGRRLAERRGPPARLPVGARQKSQL